MIAQTWAMIVDAYRELCASKLFWLTLLLSAFVVALFAMMGINDRGISILVWTVPIDMFTTNIMKESTFYKILFQSLGIGIWLTWVAAILALITTAGFFPNLIAQGMIETKLSKPIGRVRLFLTRYFTGLLFVAVQVGVFTMLSFLALGLRAGFWEPRVLLAVPIVILFFSYLYCVSVLVGVLTRSAIAAILITVLFWFLVYLLNTTDAILVGFREDRASTVEYRETRLERVERNQRATLIQMRIAEVGEEAAAGYEPTDEEIVKSLPTIGRDRAAQVSDKETLEGLVFWSDLVFKVKTVLPKTSETTALLERWLIDFDELAELRAFQEENQGERRNRGEDEDVSSQGPDSNAIADVFRDRPVSWVIGTSILFESAIVFWAMIVFVRRDY
jgi:ABC-type transport system involved in multi-copper enzyme maturation permease subunit